MYAVVGLGNPGPRYSETRHNVGFRVLDELLKKNSSGNAVWSSKFSCNFSRQRLAGEECLLVQPQKYMNLSGEAAAPLLRYFRVEPSELVVVHDELDLPPGQLRLKKGGGVAGHNGLKDLVQHLGTSEFFRVRVGIGRPGSELPDAEMNRLSSSEGSLNFPDFVSESCSFPRDVVSWVLGEPGPKGKELLVNAVSDAVQAIETLVGSGLTVAQRQFHRKKMGSS